MLTFVIPLICIVVAGLLAAWVAHQFRERKPESIEIMRDVPPEWWTDWERFYE